VRANAGFIADELATTVTALAERAVAKQSGNYDCGHDDQ
jgi:hypothetical protein